MGFQFRRRTRGKKGWLNFSGSGVSASVKLTPNITMNLGSKGTRTTVNFGGGFRYVTTKSRKKAPAKKKRDSWSEKFNKWCQDYEEKQQAKEILTESINSVNKIELSPENKKALDDIFLGKQVTPVTAKLEPLPKPIEVQESVPSTFTVDPSLSEMKLEPKKSGIAWIFALPFVALGWLVKTLFVLLFFGIKWGIVGFVMYIIIGWLMTIKITDV